MKRNVLSALVVAGAIAGASPAHAETWSIGPSVAFELVSSEGTSLLVLSAPSGQNLVLPTAAPGLRIAATSSGGHHVGFLDTSFLLLAGEGGSYSITSGTLNYAYAFLPGSSPYVTAGVGTTSYNFSGGGEMITLYGVGLGARRQLMHGHGAVRFELRYDRATWPTESSAPLHSYGLRIGFDLDLTSD